MTPNLARALVVGLTMAAGALAGCAHHVDASRVLFWKHKEYRQPTKMVVVLSAARLEEDGKPRHQGMYARVYFFDGDDPIPVTANGKLTFIAYDQSKGTNKDRSPDGVYEIERERLPNHLRRDIVGDSYVMWLPYEPAQKTQVVVVGTFDGGDGKKVESSLVSIELVPALADIAGAGQAGTPPRYQRPRLAVIDSSPGPKPTLILPRGGTVDEAVVPAALREQVVRPIGGK